MNIKVENISIAQIKSGENTRGKVDKKDLQELKDSIEASGLLQEIGVVKNNSHFDLAYGFRRLEAFKLLGRMNIPAKVYPEGTDISSLKIIENLQRKDIEPLELAAAIKKYQTQSNLTFSEIAKLIGKSLYEVSQVNKLNDLIPEFQKLLKEGILKTDAAGYISKYPQDEQKEFYEEEGQYADDDELIVIEQAKRFFDNRKFRLKNFIWPLDKEFKDLPKCTECGDRSSLQEVLFGDLKGDDNCLNQTCFVKKVKQNLTDIIEELKGQEILFIKSSEYHDRYDFSPSGKQIYWKGSLKKVTKKTANALIGVLVKSDNFSDIGKTGYYEILKSSKKESSTSGKAPIDSLTPAEQNKRRLELYNRKKDLILFPMSVEIGKALIDEVQKADLKKFKTIPVEALNIIAQYVVDQAGYEKMDVLEKVYKEGKQNPLDKIFLAFILASTYDNLSHFNMGNAENYSHSDNYIRLREIAPIIGIDLKAIEDKIKPKFEELVNTHKERFIARNKFDPEKPIKEKAKKPVKKTAN